MPDVVIRHCTCRIVRRGGWGWGVDRRALADRAVRALAALLEHRLGPTDAGEVPGTVRVRVALSPRQLADLLAAAGPAAAEHDPTLTGRLLASEGGRVLRSALDEALGPHAVLPAPAPLAAPATTPALPHTPEVNGAAPDRLVAFLLDRRAQGELHLILAALSAPALALWVGALRRRVRLSAPAEGEGAALAPVSSPGANLADAPRGTAASRDVLVRELVAMIEHVAEEIGVPPSAASPSAPPAESAPALALVGPAATGQHRGDSPVGSPPSRIGAALPNGRPTRSQPGPDAVAPRKHVPRLPPRVVAPRAPAPARPGPTGAAGALAGPSPDLVLESALPFLLLRPLADLGYLEAVGVAFDAAGLNEALPAFAAALAYKVLSPPERGWRRLPGTTATAGAFAGLRHGVPEANLTRLAVYADLFAPVLDRALTLALARSHTPGEPLLLQALADGDWLLWEAEGLFPAGRADDLAGAVSLLRLFPPEVLLLERESAAPATLHRLHEAGHTFVTDAPPTRDEPWRPLAHGTARLWTNADRSPAPALRQAARLRDLVEMAGAVWQALAGARPAVPLASDPALDRSLTLAAAAALATLAWRLWGERENTDPLLVLERLGDLGGRLDEREGNLRVVVPLGRRATDLARRRCLDDVPGVPWLPGRTVAFGQG